jgi:hypothetical protein
MVVLKTSCGIFSLLVTITARQTALALWAELVYFVLAAGALHQQTFFLRLNLNAARPTARRGCVK